IVILADKKSVLLIAGGMIGREVQRRKIMEIVFNFRSVGNREAQPIEEAFYLFQRLSQGMERAGRIGRSRQRKIITGLQVGCFLLFQLVFISIKGLPG